MSETKTSQDARPVAIVTGGASGIGLAISQHFISLDYVVVVLDIDPRSQEEITTQVKGTSHTGVVVFEHCSVSNWDDLAKAFETAYQRFGKIDIVVANAGIGETFPSQMSKVDEPPIKPDFKVMDVNLTGVIFTVRLASYYMSKKNISGNESRGSIICTASMAGLYPFPLSPLYGASKFGVIGLVRSMGPVLAKYNIRINALAPAVLDTNIMKNKAVLTNMRVTPTSTLVDGVMQFMNNNEISGEVAEIHGEQVTIRPHHEIIDEYERNNLKAFWALSEWTG